MGQRKATYYLHMLVCLAFALSLTMIFAPPVFAARRSSHIRQGLIGPKTYYLALGDSLAFGYQPDLDWADGYSNYFYSNLQGFGGKIYSNLACPGETTTTMIKGGCPYPLLRKYVYTGPQLTAAVNYLHQNAGLVSPVTLDIGANDLLRDLDTSNCAISSKWSSDLATEDNNLSHVILPQLTAALTVNGQVTGDLLLMNYYDPYQNVCPNTVQYIQEINQHLLTDAGALATVVNVFTPFSGTASSNPNLCNYTWMCSMAKDIHAKNVGYAVMASALERATGY